jgi:hypothetical protein
MVCGLVFDARFSVMFPASAPAPAPATCGVAMKVPFITSNPPPGTEEFMLEPGARRCKKEAELENDDKVSKNAARAKVAEGE